MSYPSESSAGAGAAQHHHDEDEEEAPRPAASRATRYDITREPLCARDIWGEMLEHEDEQLAQELQERENALKHSKMPYMVASKPVPDARRGTDLRELPPCMAATVGYFGVALWDTNGRLVSTLPRPLGSRAVFSGDGVHLAVGHGLYPGPFASVVDVHQVLRQPSAGLPSTEVRFEREGSPVRSFAFSRCGRYLATTHVGNVSAAAVVLWEAASGKVIATIKNQHGSFMTCVAVDAKRLLGSAGGTMFLWNLDAQTLGVDGKVSAPARVFSEAHSAYITQLEFSPHGGALAVSASWDDGTVRVWQTATGLLVRALQLANDQEPLRVLSVALSPDGQRVLVAMGLCAAIFDLNSGTRVSQFAPTHYCYGATFSPCGRYVLVAGDTRGVLLESESGAHVLDLDWYGQTEEVGGAAESGSPRDFCLAVAFSPRVVMPDVNVLRGRDAARGGEFGAGTEVASGRQN